MIVIVTGPTIRPTYVQARIIERVHFLSHPLMHTVPAKPSLQYFPVLLSSGSTCRCRRQLSRPPYYKPTRLTRARDVTCTWYASRASLSLTATLSRSYLHGLASDHLSFSISTLWRLNTDGPCLSGALGEIDRV